MPVLNINETKINCTQLAYKGEGKPEDIVMVHGLASNMAFWLGDYAQQFSDKFRVTLFDLRGHGRSGLTDSGYTAQNLSMDLKELLDSLGIDKAHFVAHSFGGVVAMNYVYENPQTVSSLVLMDTQINIGRALAKSNGWSAANALQVALKESGINIDTKHHYFGYHLMTEVARFKKTGTPIPEKLYPWVQRIFEGNSPRTAEKWLDLMENTKALDELTGNDNLSANNLYKIKCPVLAIYGENSHSMATANYLNTLWSDKDFVSIKGAGHFFPKASPKMVMELCEAFWEKEGLDDLINNYECLNYISYSEDGSKKVL
ncbi:MAG: alpha/beta hydrolase [Rickettsiales bacterium]|nr:alpha/beta hydrolase [Pseudomonadota bacterium]MDA0965418.1 alpha/beta hydrolase [Pseudomonadota bacterium]MDG4542743.1 alpha/beta hydrolase [Rickettsiales bacterium]MDG4544809.1 alpha/beta hydrolase [Rickettsiales bacterium]MDG4546931.1 alpha/beta hydrolase [Rickettsiales bacterium]